MSFDANYKSIAQPPKGGSKAAPENHGAKEQSSSDKEALKYAKPCGKDR